MPRATWRIMPARTRSRWLTTSASAGSSRSVGAKSWLRRARAAQVHSARSTRADKRALRLRPPRCSSRHWSASPPWLQAAPAAIAIATKMISAISSSRRAGLRRPAWCARRCTTGTA